MTNTDLDKQVLVKYSSEMEKNIDNALVEYRKQTGENITRPEWIRMMIHKTLYFSSEENMKDKLQKIERQTKLGKLPMVIEEQCLEAIGQGQSSVKIYFLDHSDSVLPFQKSLGKLLADKLRRSKLPTFPGDKEEKIKTEDIMNDIISNLISETGLSIKWLSQKDFPNEYIYGPSVVLDVSWK